jgi:hypothetical protein
MEVAPQAADADLATAASRFSVGKLSAYELLSVEHIFFIRDPRPSSFSLGLGQACLQHSVGASRRKPSVRQAVPGRLHSAKDGSMAGWGLCLFIESLFAGAVNNGSIGGWCRPGLHTMRALFFDVDNN